MKLLLSIAMLCAGGNTESRQRDLLVDRMNRFARTYHDFAVRYDQGVLDTSLMKRLSAQWRDVETSGSWVKTGR